MASPLYPESIARCFKKLSSPSLEVFNGVLDSSLVVTHHELMHVGVVATDVLFRAAVRDGTKAKGRVLLSGLLELHTE